MTAYTKDPQAKLDYAWDWTAWLAAGETITSSTVTPQTGITLDSSSHTNTRVTAWVSGGTVGAKYELTCHIVTNQGREDDRTIRLNVRDR